MKVVCAAAVLAASATLAACDNQYFERKETLTLAAGDAVASNVAVMTQDPWPRRSRDSRIPMDGVKAQGALARYRGGQNGGYSAGGNGAGAAPMGASSAGQ